ncbi:MAG TPA: nucleotide exchange factor GrpE [Xanthomonadales bacterium]|nr:nucleotide exchange factor GrpE [Xanthomonadales bacterium]
MATNEKTALDDTSVPLNPAAGQGETDEIEAGAGAAGVVDEELQDLGQALVAAEQELALHREAMLRMQAEMENLRKRLIRDLEKSRKFALEGVMKDLLQVRDSLERGLQVTDETTSVESLKAGKELTLKMLNKVMSDHGLEVINPAGEAFDPEFHEAVTLLPSPDHPENTVLDVLQKGFKLHDRLIRPAMVVVSSSE